MLSGDVYATNVGTQCPCPLHIPITLCCGNTSRWPAVWPSQYIFQGGKKNKKTHQSLEQGIGNIVESDILKDCCAVLPQHVSRAREVKVANVGE